MKEIFIPKTTLYNLLSNDYAQLPQPIEINALIVSDYTPTVVLDGLEIETDADKYYIPNAKSVLILTKESIINLMLHCWCIVKSDIYPEGVKIGIEGELPR